MQCFPEKLWVVACELSLPHWKNFSGMARRTGERAWSVDLASKLPRSQSDRTFMRHPWTSPNHGCQIVDQSWLWPITASPVVSGTGTFAADRFCSVAERIVLLGGRGHQGVLLPSRGVLGLQRCLSGWSGGIHMNASTHYSPQLFVVSLFCFIVLYVKLLL